MGVSFSGFGSRKFLELAFCPRSTRSHVQSEACFVVRQLVLAFLQTQKKVGAILVGLCGIGVALSTETRIG